MASTSVSATGHAAAAEGGASEEELHEQKRRLKHAMRQWELQFEATHGGLVPTHEDKKGMRRTAS